MRGISNLAIPPGLLAKRDDQNHAIDEEAEGRPRAQVKRSPEYGQGISNLSIPLSLLAKKDDADSSSVEEESGTRLQSPTTLLGLAMGGVEIVGVF